MSVDVTSIDAEIDFVTAAEVFLDRPFRSYPVTRNGELVGVVYHFNLLQGFVRFG